MTQTVQNRDVKGNAFNWTKQDKTCEISRKSSFNKVRTTSSFQNAGSQLCFRFCCWCCSCCCCCFYKKKGHVVQFQWPRISPSPARVPHRHIETSRFLKTTIVRAMWQKYARLVQFLVTLNNALISTTYIPWNSCKLYRYFDISYVAGNNFAVGQLLR